MISERFFEVCCESYVRFCFCVGCYDCLIGTLRSFQGIFLEGGIRLLFGSYTVCWVVALGLCCNRRGVFFCDEIMDFMFGMQE